ncbi:MAG: bifunctional diaminohydroxyphosphoribosylaminopyrimidine deaminase/5-amino-6-(5-phosphoribosylamino)uracil reductase RibD, partial [Bacteroidales bacterium]|nr:bifunctional diaminohydroxyphosphoribosylaminopyrimidine deaminase/5-amino-6-(5-phosphoribosylamino)uracil reductase RibD [Bacteroidales bacterium]
MDIHDTYMRRCIDLALQGLGHVAPNPLVGAVLVVNNKIIGEGYHQQFGGPHAEVMAISSVSDPQLLRRATLYVNLEPCCHHGKTPPCTDLIISHGIREVVIGTVDPFDAVAGKGVARLRATGCRVSVGVLKDECRDLNKRFFTFHEKKRPYIVLKWAQTADGFIDTERLPDAAKKPTWITSEHLRMLVHKWRTEEASIMVGTNTALKDNPRLNVRDWHGPSPMRIVLDRTLKLTPQYHLMDNSQKTLIINEIYTKKEKNTQFVAIPFDQHLIKNICDLLYRQGIQSILVEGGRQLLQSLIDQKLWDEARIFTGAQFFGKGIPAPTLKTYK